MNNAGRMDQKPCVYWFSGLILGAAPCLQRCELGVKSEGLSQENGFEPGMQTDNGRSSNKKGLQAY